VIVKEGLSSTALSEENSSTLSTKLSRTTTQPDKKRPFNKRDSQVSIHAYFESSKKPKLGEHSFSSGSASPDTIDLTDENKDKENIYPFSSLLLSSTTLRSGEKRKQDLATFKNYFRSSSSQANYEEVKKDLLNQKWPLSKKGNPYIRISSRQSPDGKPHHIVISQSPSKFGGEMEYSAFIDDQPYSTFIEHPPLGRAWFPELDSIKRATINIIYKKR
jgi:hypothetical protein